MAVGTTDFHTLMSYRSPAGHVTHSTKTIGLEQNECERKNSTSLIEKQTVT
jgi:hypothetical protein